MNVQPDKELHLNLSYVWIKLILTLIVNWFHTNFFECAPVILNKIFYVGVIHLIQKWSDQLLCVLYVSLVSSVLVSTCWVCIVLFIWPTLTLRMLKTPLLEIPCRIHLPVCLKTLFLNFLISFESSHWLWLSWKLHVSSQTTMIYYNYHKTM